MGIQSCEDSACGVFRSDIHHPLDIIGSISLQILILFNLTKIFFTKMVHKIANPLLLRIIAVINRVLIFRPLKWGRGLIFSYSFS